MGEGKYGEDRYDEDNPPPGQPRDGGERRNSNDGGYEVYRVGKGWVDADSEDV